MAGERVQLEIVGKQWEPGEEPQEIRLLTEGKLYRRAEETVIAYRETEQSGLGRTMTTLKVLPDGAIELLRMGDTSMKMHFLKGDRHLTQLDTPYGMLQIGLLTHEASADLGQEQGDIAIRYSLDHSQQNPVNMELNLHYERTGRHDDTRA